MVHVSDLRRPVIGVGAVVWKGDAVLLVRRATPPLMGQWSIPGGKIEFGEATSEACLREIREETGVDAALAGLVDVVDAVLKDDGGRIERHYVLIDYAARWLSGEPRAGGDAADAKWVARTEVNAHVDWPETRRIIEESRRLLTAAD